MILFISIYVIITLHAIRAHATNFSHSASFLQEQENPESNIALAFSLIGISALFSILGAIVPFIDRYLAPRHSKFVSSQAFFSSTFGFASGLLLFLALSSMYNEAVTAWNDSKLVPAKYAPLIVSGILLIVFFLLWIKSITFPHNHHDSLGSASSSSVDDENSHLLSDAAKVRLSRISTQLGIALAIHNFPEGLATFAMALKSARIGVMFAVAIAMHKIPEGIIISLPMYYATQSPVKAFLFTALVSGCSQIAGGLCGYLLYLTLWNPAVYGVMFAVAIAILVWTVFAEMLPVARGFDRDDVYVTPSVVLGVLFFATVNSVFALVA